VKTVNNKIPKKELTQISVETTTTKRKLLLQHPKKIIYDSYITIGEKLA